MKKKSMVMKFQNDRFHFDSRGLPKDGSADPSGSVSITGGTGTNTVDVNKLGRVKTQW